MRKRLALLERVVSDIQRVAQALTHVGHACDDAGVRFAARKLIGALEKLER